jgi:hypothetical protein
MASTSGVPKGDGLQAGNLLPQQLGLHGHLADLPLQPRDLVVAVVALVLLQRRLGGQQREALGSYLRVGLQVPAGVLHHGCETSGCIVHAA